MKDAKTAAKAKIKDKLAKTKEKVKAKVKGGVKASVAVMAAVLSLVLYEGCSTATPASRATTAQYRFEFAFDDSSRGNTVNLTLGDGALASADSAGSTETQTATPTTTIDVKPDIRYNDAIAGATSASKGVLSAIGYGADAVLEMMAGKKSGTVKVQKTDGTEATVECKDGQCSFVDGACAGGSCSTGGAK